MENYTEGLEGWKDVVNCLKKKKRSKQTQADEKIDSNNLQDKQKRNSDLAAVRE